MQTINYNGDSLSQLSLGTVQFGLEYGVANQSGQPKLEEVKKIIDFLSDNGINCFDTAAAYGNSEEVLGKVLNTDKKAYIISKIKSDAFLKNVEYHIETSLKKLHTDQLYGLLLHDCKLLYNWNADYTKNVHKLIKSKKIQYFGVSIYTKDEFELALNNEEISFIQIPFNIFDQRALTLDWFKKAKDKNKLLFIRSVFLQGLLLMDINQLPMNLHSAKKDLELYQDYCDKLALSKNALALSFVTSTAKDCIILFGCDNILQARENISTLNSLKALNNKTLERIRDSFKDVTEDIYNPTRW